MGPPPPTQKHELAHLSGSLVVSPPQIQDQLTWGLPFPTLCLPLLPLATRPDLGRAARLCQDLSLKNKALKKNCKTAHAPLKWFPSLQARCSPTTEALLTSALSFYHPHSHSAPGPLHPPFVLPGMQNFTSEAQPLSKHAIRVPSQG
jgi:hypothetical protein